MDAVYRFEFDQDIPIKEIEDTLFWAVLNAESIFGKSKVRLDGSFYFDRSKRICVIDKTTEVGQHIAQIFTSLISRSFGETAFRVNRLRKKKKFTEDKPSPQNKPLSSASKSQTENPRRNNV
jgi:hypothetical protein